MQTEENNLQGSAVLGFERYEIPLKALFDRSAQSWLLNDCAETNQQLLKDRLGRDPEILKTLSNEELADILESISGLKEPDTSVLSAIYDAYNPLENPAFNTLREKRNIFFETLASDPVVQKALTNWHDISDEDKMAIAEHLHLLHAKSFGFEPARLEPCVRPPVGEIGQQRMSYGSYDRTENVIYYNIYSPRPDDMVPTFRKDFIDFAATILHEGDHAFQNSVVKKLTNNELEDPELRSFGRIMRDSTQGLYYLDQPRVPVAAYFSNPSEKHAYEFQGAMEAFLKSGCRINPVSLQVTPQISLYSPLPH